MQNTQRQQYHQHFLNINYRWYNLSLSLTVIFVDVACCLPLLLSAQELEPIQVTFKPSLWTGASLASQRPRALIKLAFHYGC